MPITHNIKSPVTLAAADITEAEIANGAVTDNKVNFTSSIAVGNSTVNTTINTTSVSVDSTVVSNGSIAVGNSTVNTSITNQTIITYAPITNKNLIINGGMNVYQRTANSGSTSANGYHLADRFETTGTNHGSQTHGITTDVPSGYGFTSSYNIYRGGANDSLAPNPSAATILTLSQKIEGQNLQHLCKGTSNAKELTLSFWSKFSSGNGNVFVAELVDLDNNRQISKALSSSSDWTKNTVTFPADTTGAFDNDNNASLQLNIWLNAGSNYTSGTFNDSAWASTTDANRVKSDIMHFMSVDSSTGAPTSFHFTGVQLEVGNTATQFEFEPYNVIEDKCFRYYEEMYVPAHPNMLKGPTFAYGAQNDGYVPFKVRKRATPGVTEHSISFNTDGNVSTITPRRINHNSFNQGFILNANQNAYVEKYGTYKADAEL